MVLNVELLRREAQGAMWVSPARVCLTANGGLVDCEHVTAVKLLVGEGGSLPVAEAERYGLVGRHVAEVQITAPAAPPVSVAAPEEPVTEKAQEPTENKQIVAPGNKRIARKK